ncbi:MAG: isochorismatase family cysteine hydrolase [Nocardioides sp.]|uniref:cysteine hydrolase family protein n=1 Tax=Nocardioides sp. TaxID=35761 RepID=UPI0039E36E89
MSVTTIGPDAALVVVDLQVALVAGLAERGSGAVVENTVRLADAFRRSGRAVALLTTDLNDPPVGRNDHASPRPPVPSAGLAIVPDLAPEPGDIVIEKRGWGGFVGTGLDARLRERGIGQVVLAGVATGFGIESTARQAYDAGYHVVVALDAITDPRPHGHDFTVTEILPALAETGSTADVLDLL